MDADEVAPYLSTVPEGSKLKNRWLCENRKKNNNSEHDMLSSGLHLSIPAFGHRPSQASNQPGVAVENLAGTGNAGDKANVMISGWWGRPLFSASLGLIRG